jgi:hypothetical protein
MPRGNLKIQRSSRHIHKVRMIIVTKVVMVIQTVQAKNFYNHHISEKKNPRKLIFWMFTIPLSSINLQKIGGFKHSYRSVIVPHR